LTLFGCVAASGGDVWFTPGKAWRREAVMKPLILVGVFAGALAAGPAFAQAAGKSGDAAKGGGAGHTAPKSQPNTAAAPAVPAGEMALGAVTLPKSVKADGKVLPAGTYQMRLTAQTASPDAKGQTPTLERWVEFVQRGQVKGREVVTIVPQAEITAVQKDAPPKANSSKFEALKDGDYARLWLNRGGNHYLMHFPLA
jgi:hypothetical protein